MQRSFLLYYFYKITYVNVVSSTAGNNVTDEELESMLESGQTDVFTQNVSVLYCVVCMSCIVPIDILCFFPSTITWRKQFTLGVCDIMILIMDV